MGIRFRCPNGHSLHVKAFLAGKRGICPECGQKFTIPAESDPEVLAARGAKKTASGVSAETATPKIVTTRPTREPPETPVPDTDVAGGNWYVRPPAGGQFGPANETLFAQWLAEGRVPRDSYVWREGWKEWQPASEILPPDPNQAVKAKPAPPAKPNPAREKAPAMDVAEVGNPPGRPAASSASATPSVLPQVVVTNKETPAIGSYRRQKASRTMGIVIALLTVACIALFAALIFVIRG